MCGGVAGSQGSSCGSYRTEAVAHNPGGAEFAYQVSGGFAFIAIVPR